MKAAVLLLALPCVLASVVDTVSTNKRPNILFLQTDSMDGRVLDPTNPLWDVMELPNFRKVARNGVNFVRNYAASPQCVPSRSTMFTSKMTHVIHTWNNGQGLGMDTHGNVDRHCAAKWSVEQCLAWGAVQNVSHTIVDTMKALGYQTVLHGKVDVGANIDTTDDHASGFHGGPSLNILTRAANIDKPTKPNPEKITNDNKESHPGDYHIINDCVNFLKNRSAWREPWILYCSINIPHPPFDTKGKQWWDMVNASRITTPPWPKDWQKAYHPYDQYMTISKHVEGSFTDADILKTRHTYYSMCTQSDAMLGEVLTALEQTGTYNQTYIMYVSDHGEMNMEHRQVWKNSLYEPSSRVPMIVAGPGIKGGRVVTNHTSLLDVYPTLAVLGGGNPPSDLQGHSLVGDFLKPKLYPPSGRPGYITSQYHSNMGNTGSFMVRWAEWKYIVFGTNGAAFKNYGPMLYNMEKDDLELHNVVAEHPDVVAKMQTMLEERIGNVQGIDLKVKLQDRALFKKFFVDRMTTKQLMHHFDRSYHGFNETSWNKIWVWYKEFAPQDEVVADVEKWDVEV
eukprot:TRINITY_DN62062_c0_g1_i1.p1 TRINITY_DN62062_c0_g1~~TRINITY_DN62062_c0_g1_i1.p1  ORF type:complete len:566 (+),score=66.39 TRINITY_DN62062_c0_g1_i1:32-1729(+)